VLGAAVAGGAVLLTPALARAAEGGGLIELNWTLFVQILNFLVLLVVLYVLAYKPLLGALEGRQASIRQQLAEAREAREQAQRQAAEFESRLREAQAEAQAVRERVLREAAETRERLTGEARREAARLLEAARAEIRQDVRQARQELRGEVGTLAVEIAERLIQKSVQGADHQRLVREALARMDSPRGGA
jgi:F-type H+-transporting ATPase subunit b